MTTENTPNSGAPDGGQITIPDGTKENYEHLKAEAQKAFKARDDAKALARTQEERIKALEKELEKRGLDEANKSGETDKINKAWEERLNKREKELLDKVSGLESRFKKAVVERDFHAIAADQTVSMASLLGTLQYQGYALESVQGDDGSESLVIKTPQGMTRSDVKKWLDEFLEENQHLARSGRKAGTNSQGTKDNGNKGLDVEAIKRMTSAEQQKAFNENPEAAKKLLKSVRFGG